VTGTGRRKGSKGTGKHGNAERYTVVTRAKEEEGGKGQDKMEKQTGIQLWQELEEENDRKKTGQDEDRNKDRYILVTGAGRGKWHENDMKMTRLDKGRNTDRFTVLPGTGEGNGPEKHRTG
jgi:hypothetical protein